MEPRPVADLVDQLFRSHLRPDGKEYTYLEVAEALGGRVDASSIAKLRKGKITNPGRNVLLSLCRFFQVPASYFFPELDELSPSHGQQSAEQQLQVALRSSGLPPDVQQHIEGLINAFRRRQPS